MGHIGRRAAHVKANDLAMTGNFCGAGHAHNAASGATQDSVFSSEGMCISEPTRRLHEHEFDTWHFLGNLIDIAFQNGRKVRIHHRGIASADKLHQRTGLV